ncbi:MAG: PP2C family protein-serine/threonine phosphatase [Oscillospiraceae bacterium]|nr:PP2C family protein-serine/threonine phosphatase [Oscillospiraceae bacterium]
MDRLRKLRSSMAANIIGAILALLAIFGLIVSVFGFVSFTDAFKNEYTVSTYHMADTATTLVNGDHLDAYLRGEETEEYERTRSYLDIYCKRMNVSIIYVIEVDRSDYGRFVSVFNHVNNAVDDTSYTAWELGHERETTNDEYRQKYQAIYEQGSPYETVYRIRTNDGLHSHITTMVPVKNSSGDAAGILCIQRPVREIYDARRPYLRSIVFSTLLLSLLASVFAVGYLRVHLVTPIRRVSDEAARFAREGTKGEDLEGISPYKELSGLAASIDKMETDTLRYMENLSTAAAEKERIGFELSLASRIQAASIPSEFPAFPERKDFDIYGVMDPARDVGGDFYNFFLVDDDHLALAIGDVSGKGIPASLFMMVTNIILTDRTRMGGGPGEILDYVNREICAHNSAEMFVTIWLGILELSTGRLTASNAGHEYPALMRAGGAFALYKDKHAFVIGGMEGVRYREYELKLSPGDKLFVYTDGVPEATAADETMFGTERMLAALNEDAQAAPERLLRNVRRAVDGFVQGTEQFDDLTMLCIEYRGGSARTDEPTREE